MKLVAWVRNLPTSVVNVVLPFQGGGIFREEFILLPRSWRQQDSPQKQENFCHAPQCYIREGSKTHVNRQDIKRTSFIWRISSQESTEVAVIEHAVQNHSYVDENYAL